MGWHKNGVGTWNLKIYTRFLEERNHEIHRTSPSCHNYQQKPLSLISTTFSCGQNYNWDISEKNKSAIIKANQEGKSALFVSQMYSKSLTERRNAALKYRADLKEQDPSIQGYVKFTAILMIKRTGDRKYSLEIEFWTILVSFLL